MTDGERNYYYTFVRMRDFAVANNDAIKNVGAAAANFALISAGVDAIEASGELQSTGRIANGVARKDFALAELRLSMRRINRTSRSLAVDNPGIAELFRMPHNNNEQQILAAARAFLNNAQPVRQLFIDYGLPADFIAELGADIEDYEHAVAHKNTALDESVAATANIGATVAETLNAMRRLRGIVQNIFANDPAKLAEWKAASHVERAPKTKHDTDNSSNGNNQSN